MYSALLFLVTFFAPGRLALLGSPVQKNLGAFSFLVSYSLIVVNFRFLPEFAVGYFWFLSILLLEGAIIALTFWAVRKYHYAERSIAQKNPKRLSIFRALVIILLVLGYLLVVGSYTEVPADVLSHFGHIQNYLQRLSQGALETGQPWYAVFAQILALSGETISDVAFPLTLLFSTGFALLVASISNELAGLEESSKTTRFVVPIVAVIGTFCFFGTSIFSYVRYYVFAPTFGVYPLYLLSLVFVGRLVSGSKSRESRPLSLLGLTLAVFVSWHVHRQESIFIISVIGVGGLLYAGHYLKKIMGRFDFHKKIVVLLVIIVVFVCSSLWFLAHQLNTNGTHEDILIGNTIQILTIRDQSIVVGDPFGRILETITPAGCLIVGVFLILRWKCLRTNPLAIAIVAVPLTVFNPAFTVIFLENAAPEVLWRMAYMIPIGITFAALAGYILEYRRKLIAVTLSVFAATAMIVETAADEKHRLLRWPTLRQIPVENSVENVGDLIRFLKRYEYRNVLTDPVTGYVISGFTSNWNYRQKFWKGHQFYEINKLKYSPQSFEDHENWLFIVNRRGWASRGNGQLSGHWPIETLTTERFYSPKLIEFLSDKPKHFEKVWESDDIWVYEIKEKG
jgi:hypothetical protein